MNLRRTQFLASGVLLCFASLVPAQTALPTPPPNGAVIASGTSNAAAPTDAPPPATVPSLDVISVKPDKSGGGMMRMGSTPDGISNTNIPAHLLLTQAYHVNDDQIINEPAWAKTERYDVDGKVAGPDAAVVSKLTQDQKRVFFQQVLKERFGLAMHRETRELPEYALVVAKGGPKLKESKEDSKEESNKPDPKGPPGPPGPGDKMRGRGMRMSMGPNGRKLEANQAGLDFLLQILSNETGRTVVDKTGLTGKYDFTLNWAPMMGSGAREGSAGDAAPPPDAGPDLFTAIQEQLGLKLEPIKGPVDVVVIDHIERPEEN